MTIKWTVDDAIQSLKNLTNPFEQTGMQNPTQKPKLPRVEDIIAVANRNNGGNEVVNR